MRIRSVLVLLGLLVSAAVPAQGQTTVSVSSEPATGEKYHVEFGGFLWNPNPTIIIRSEALTEAHIGSTINFVTELGLEQQRFGQIKAHLRPAKKHKFRFEYTPISYENPGFNLTRDVIFNGQLYRLTLPVATELRWDAFRFGYEYDIISRDRGFSAFCSTSSTHVEATLRQGGHRPRGIRARPRPHPLDRRHRACLCRAQYLDHCRVQWLQPAGEHQRELRAHYFDFDLYGSINFTHNFGAQLGYRSFDVFYLIDDEDEGELKLKGSYLGRRRQVLGRQFRPHTSEKPRIAAVGIDLRGAEACAGRESEPRRAALVVQRTSMRRSSPGPNVISSRHAPAWTSTVFSTAPFRNRTPTVGCRASVWTTIDESRSPPTQKASGSGEAAVVEEIDDGTGIMHGAAGEFGRQTIFRADEPNRLEQQPPDVAARVFVNPHHDGPHVDREIEKHRPVRRAQRLGLQRELVTPDAQHHPAFDSSRGKGESVLSCGNRGDGIERTIIASGAAWRSRERWCHADRGGHCVSRQSLGGAQPHCQQPAFGGQPPQRLELSGNR